MIPVQPYRLDDLCGMLPPRPLNSHKGDYGHVLVIGGNHGMGGAARMAAESAARLGAGLVSVATRAAHAHVIAAQRPELMVHGVDDKQGLDSLIERTTVIVVGPGLGLDDWAQGLLEAALKAERPMVIDADALNLLAGMGRRVTDNAILTPHPGEAARLLDSSSHAVQADRPHAVQQLRKAYGGVWLLKGAGTLICSDGQLSVCLHGHPGMASGGMGDVLSGMLGALLAQGLDVPSAARLGVALHAAAGEEAARVDGGRGLLALDLLPHARRLLEDTSPCLR